LDLLSPTTLSSPEALSSLHSLFSGRNPSLYRISLSLRSGGGEDWCGDQPWRICWCCWLLKIGKRIATVLLFFTVNNIKN
jgi:hypothetical protein